MAPFGFVVPLQAEQVSREVAGVIGEGFGPTCAQRRSPCSGDLDVEGSERPQTNSYRAHSPARIILDSWQCGQPAIVVVYVNRGRFDVNAGRRKGAAVADGYATFGSE